VLLSKGGAKAAFLLALKDAENVRVPLVRAARARNPAPAREPRGGARPAGAQARAQDDRQAARGASA
jgi:hypothetical protein